MRSFLITCSVTLLALSAFAQSDRGAISGTVVDPGGHAFVGATVEAKNPQTGAITKTMTGAGGKYSLPDLPAGAYDISVNLQGVRPFERKGVAVEAAKTTELMIKLEEGTQLSTLGEDPLGAIADGK